MVIQKIIINNIIFLNVSISLKLLILGLTRIKGGGLKGLDIYLLLYKGWQAAENRRFIVPILQYWQVTLIEILYLINTHFSINCINGKPQRK